MAFTKTPTADTYSQEDISLTREWTSRQGDPTGAKDEHFLNCIFEIVKSKGLQDNRQFLMKRAGVSTYLTPAVSGNIRGMFYWKDSNKLLYCISDDVYMYDTSTAATVTMNTVFGTTSGTVGFTTFLYDTGTVKVVATDGTTLVTIDSAGTVVPCADADLPTPHIPKPVFIDGYLVVVKSNTASLYNSDLNDPLLWTAGNVIDAEMDGDRIVNIDKINNYIVAFGSSSIEYFWDAAVATGSPFQRNETPIKINKLIGGITRFGNAIFYIGLNENSQPDVFKLQDFQIEPVGTPTITRYLNAQTAAYTTYVGALLSCLGHTFYILNVGNYTFVYDTETKIWDRWAYQSSTNFNVTNFVLVQTTSTTFTGFTLGTNSVIHKLDDTVYQDNGTNFTFKFVTEPADFGTLNRKSMSMLSIVCDRPSVSSNATISWSDDDFQTFTAGVTVDLDQDLPSIRRLGSFRQRSFKFEYADNYPCRVQRFLVNINKGRQ